MIHEFGEPSVVRTEEVDDPLVGPDYVLIKVAAAGVNSVDWKVVAGYLQGAFPHHLPLIPGCDVSDEVVGVGPAVTHIAVGDRVSAYARKDHVQNGTFAELVAVHIRSITKVPDDVDLVEAGALPLAGLTAAQQLAATEVAAGDTVLVHAAAGGVGSFATQLAVARGARVIGTGSAASHAYLRGLGAEPVEYGEGLTTRVEESSVPAAPMSSWTSSAATRSRPLPSCSHATAGWRRSSMPTPCTSSAAVTSSSGRTRTR